MRNSTTLALLVCFAASPELPAQTYDISWHTIGPGGTSAGGTYVVRSSIGQWDAGNMSSSNLSLAGGFWVFLGASVTTPPQYTIVDLGATAGQPRGVNSAGRMAGYSYTYSNGTGYAQGVFWPSAGSSQLPLRTFGGDASSAYGLNDSGQIVGSADLAGTSVGHAAIWLDGSASPLDLGSFGGASAAYGLNRAGQIVGYSSTPTNWSRPVFWPSANSVPVELNSFGGTYNFADSINDSGQIVGAVSLPGGGSQHAAFWANSTGAPVDLGTDGLDSSMAWAINSSGQIVGSTEGNTVGFLRRPLYWPSGSSAPMRLGTLSDYYTSAAVGINASGQIVGYSTLAPVPEVHAVLWNVTRTVPTDLNTFLPTGSGWLLQYATAINDAGEIVGTGTYSGGTHAFALVPSVWALRILSVGKVGTDLQIRFTSQAGHTYNLLGTSNLVTGPWDTLQTGVPGNGAIIQIAHPQDPVRPSQFFRIQQAR